MNIREIRGNLLSVAVVFTAVAAVAVVFPFDAVTFSPAKAKDGKGAFAAFVTLSHKEEVAAMKAAKSSWNAEAGGVRRIRAELFSVDLPESESEPSLRLEDRFSGFAPSVVAPGLMPYQPSMAAPAPTKIPHAKSDDEGKSAATFSREEMLEIN